MLPASARAVLWHREWHFRILASSNHYPLLVEATITAYHQVRSENMETIFQFCPEYVWYNQILSRRFDNSCSQKNTNHNFTGYVGLCKESVTSEETYGITIHFDKVNMCPNSSFQGGVRHFIHKCKAYSDLLAGRNTSELDSTPSSDANIAWFQRSNSSGWHGAAVPSKFGAKLDQSDQTYNYWRRSHLDSRKVPSFTQENFWNRI